MPFFRKMTFALLTLPLLFLSVANAQKFTSEHLEQKSKLESAIQQSIEKTISTNIDKQYFTVSVSVALTESKKQQEPEQKPPQTDASQIKSLTDMQMGLINSEDLIRKYQAEIEGYKKNKSDFEPEKPIAYYLKSVNVIVGLDKKLGADYIPKFQGWLEAQLKAQFGSIAKAEVMEISTAQPPPEVPRTWKDDLKDFQGLAIALLVFLGFVMAVLLFKFIKSRDADESRKMTMQLSGKTLGPDGKPVPGNELENSRKSEMTMLADFKNMKDLTGKINSLIIEADLDINNVISAWLEKGEEGLDKTACLIDSLMSASSSFRDDNENIEYIKSIDIPKPFREPLAQTLMQMKKQDPTHKIAILESIYWDLLSFQTLGERFMRKPFSYAASQDPARLKEALLGKSMKERVIAMLSLPEEVKSRVVQELPYEDRASILEHSFGMDPIDAQEIDVISESLRGELQGKEDKQTISNLELIPDLLGALPVLEEMAFLRKMYMKSPAAIQSFCKTWPTMTFFTEWSEGAKKRFLGKCTNDEIESLIRVLPSSEETILEACPALVKQILLDELKIENRMDQDTLTRAVTSCRAKLIGALNAKDIKIVDTLPGGTPVSTTGDFEAAA